MAHPTDAAVRVWDDMYTTTWQIRRSQLTDQVMQATPVFYKLAQGGRVQTEPGGLYIEEPVSFGLNPTIKTVSRAETVTFQDVDMRTVAQWRWRYVHGMIQSFFADRQRNAGKNAIINKVNADINLLRDSTVQQFEFYLFGDGTGNDGKDLDGLGNIIAVDPTSGTVGGIDRATYDWWRNQMSSMSGLSMASYLQDYMRTMYNNCGHLVGGGQQFPDLIVTTQTIEEALEKIADERVILAMSDMNMVKFGVGSLQYKTAPIVWSPQCPTGYMYFINTSTFRFVKDSSAFMKLGEWMRVQNAAADDRVAHMISVCNLTNNCPAKNGVIHTITTA